MSSPLKEEMLTSYVLGELSEADRKKVERIMRDAPKMRAEVEELHALTRRLTASLANEPQLQLDGARKAAIEVAARGQETGTGQMPRARLSRPKVWGLGAALAAGVAAAVALWPTSHRETSILAPTTPKTVAHEKEKATPAPAAEETRFVAAPVEKPARAEPSHATADVAPSTGALITAEKRPLAKADRRTPARARIVDKSYPQESFGGEEYEPIVDNPFRTPEEDARSTFSVDVDTASYANVRRYLNGNTLPPPGAVRIEEMLNYFRYDYAPAPADRPLGVDIEVTEAPWAKDHRLVRIGLSGKDVPKAERPPINLVFLIDVSGSMVTALRLPLVIQGLKLLTRELSARDRVAIVVYAGASGLVLPSTSGAEQATIVAALERLHAGGSTNGAAGIELAYQTAEAAKTPGCVSRVVLATDGDFNVGVTSRDALLRLIQKEAKSGTFLSVLGFGMGNIKDATLELLADKGNGHYAYVDSLAEARKVLVEEVGGTLVTIAKDVKLQLEMNPANVAAYRLIGYENRLLAHADFNDDAKDAGDVGAGHQVTALYEIIPHGVAVPAGGVDALKYRKPSSAPASSSDELMTVKLRYKAPTSDKSSLIEYAVHDAKKPIAQASPETRWAASIAEVGMLLRDSPHKGLASYDEAIALGQESQGRDPMGRRREFLELARAAKRLSTSGVIHDAVKP